MSKLKYNSLVLERDDCTFFFTESLKKDILPVHREMIARSMYLAWHDEFSNAGTEFDIHIVEKIRQSNTKLGFYDTSNRRITLARTTIFNMDPFFSGCNYNLIFNDTAAHEARHQVQHKLYRKMPRVPDPDEDEEGYYNHPLEVEARNTGYYIHHFILNHSETGEYPKCFPHLVMFAHKYDEFAEVNESSETKKNFYILTI